MSNSLIKSLSCLAHPSRIQLLKWLRNPTRYFPPQVDGDLLTDGVCAVFIAQKWEVTPPTASRHLKMLVDTGLLVATRKKGWTFYRRNETGIKKLKQSLDLEI